MSDLQKLKDRAQFFKRGHIIPFRVMACRPRKFQHLMAFGSDCWVLPGSRGYVVFIHYSSDQKGSSAILLKKGLRNAKGSIWHGPKAITQFIGDVGMSTQEFTDSIEKALKP